MSSGLFIRMSMRLSHWLRICGWILDGRCDDRRSQSPYFRPSAAIWMSRSRSSCATGLPGSVLQRLCASSMTRRVGTRRSRCAHSSSTTSRQTASGSAGSPNPPRSMTVTPCAPVTTSAADGRSNAHTSHSGRPRFSMRRASRCSAAVPSFMLPSRMPRSTSPSCASRVMNALYSSWSRTGSSCATAAWAFRVMARKRIRNGSAPSVRVELERSTRIRSARRAASVPGVPSLVSPRRTKSALGSITTTRRSVPRMSRSSRTPRA